MLGEAKKAEEEYHFASGAASEIPFFAFFFIRFLIPFFFFRRWSNSRKRAATRHASMYGRKWNEIR